MLCFACAAPLSNDFGKEVGWSEPPSTDNVTGGDIDF